MKLHFAVLALAALPLSALADEQGLQTAFYVAGGGGTRGSSISVGGGLNEVAIEISSIYLGAVRGASSVKFTGLSLVQNAAPVKGFNFLFRIGIGKETTTFNNGATATQEWLGGGIFFGIGEQYQVNKHLAFRGEVYRIAYAATADGSVTGVRYPVTLSALYIF